MILVVDFFILQICIDGKLAHPSGIALSTDENESMLYVSETGMNRILRIVSHPSGVYHTGVFHQFSGRFGPTALAMHPDGRLFVARYDFTDCSKHGLISVLNQDGVVEEEL